MALQLEWIDQTIDEYYIAGAIFSDFDHNNQYKVLLNLVESDNPIYLYFNRIEEMMVIREFSHVEPGEEDYCFELDDAIIEFIIKYRENPSVLIYTAIICLQFFEFDALKEILEIEESELEELEPEEKDEIIAIQEEFSSMDPVALQNFLDKEIFFYEKEELEEFLLTHS